VAIDVGGEPGMLTIRLSGVDAVLSLKRRLDVPGHRITSVDVVPRRDVPRSPGTWLRAPGTHLPGVARYGSYGRRPRREFWAVRRQDPVLMIEAADWDYARIVLGVPDPGTAAGIARTCRSEPA
jgi:hypothetical protein